jgi:hypothetical protein
MKNVIILALVATGPAVGPTPPPTLRATNERVTVHAVARTPKLEGPDDLVKAPVIVLSSEKAELDGQAMKPNELERELAKRWKNYAVEHPGEPFYGEVIVACAPRTPTEHLRGPLREALAAGYPNVLFAFLHEIPGTGWSTGSAVRASIAPLGKKVRTATGTATLGAYEDCLGLSQALLELRASQPVVRLEINEKAKPTAERPKP